MEERSAFTLSQRDSAIRSCLVAFSINHLIRQIRPSLDIVMHTILGDGAVPHMGAFVPVCDLGSNLLQTDAKDEDRYQRFPAFRGHEILIGFKGIYITAMRCKVTAPTMSKAREPSSPRSTAEFSPRDAQRSSSTTYRWRPSLWRARPLIGIISMLVAVMALLVSLSILLVSDGQAVADWYFQPTVYLAIATASVNAALQCALAQAAPISWWYKALRGSTVQDLELNYEAGESCMYTSERKTYPKHGDTVCICIKQTLSLAAFHLA